MLNLKPFSSHHHSKPKHRNVKSCRKRSVCPNVASLSVCYTITNLLQAKCASLDVLLLVAENISPCAQRAIVISIVVTVWIHWSHHRLPHRQSPPPRCSFPQLSRFCIHLSYYLCQKGHCTRPILSACSDQQCIPFLGEAGSRSMETISHKGTEEETRRQRRRAFIPVGNYL